jgi:hypothetical protein
MNLQVDRHLTRDEVSLFMAGAVAAWIGVYLSLGL